MRKLKLFAGSREWLAYDETQVTHYVLSCQLIQCLDDSFLFQRYLVREYFQAMVNSSKIDSKLPALKTIFHSSNYLFGETIYDTNNEPVKFSVLVVC